MVKLWWSESEIVKPKKLIYSYFCFYTGDLKPYEISVQANHNKKNMFALLGRPGYEDMTKELNARL